MALVEVDAETDRYLEFAARVARMTKGEVVAQLVAGGSPLPGQESTEPAPGIDVHADYEGHRTRALFVPGPGRLEITDGPLTGKVFRTPSEAAREVVKRYKPAVSPHRNGWSFWIVSATGLPLQTLRHQQGR